MRMDLDADGWSAATFGRISVLFLYDYALRGVSGFV